MKRTGIIGMGVISRAYFEGITKTEKLKLVAVCDKEKEYPTKDIYDDFRYYDDYLTMIKREKLDYVIISTPPASHYQIAKNCLTAGVNVIIEKPVVLQMGLLHDLIKTAKAKNLDFQVMYHWQNGEEVEAFLARYDRKKISKICVSVLDPYSSDGVSINADREQLAGAWIDSGVNSLSYVKCFLDFDSVEIEDIQIQRCARTNLPICAAVKLTIDGVDVEITVDWTKGQNCKQSTLTYDGREIAVSHSKQTIYDGDTVIKCDSKDRLSRHYYNFFVKNLKARGDTADTIKIHEVLLRVRDKYEEMAT